MNQNIILFWSFHQRYNLSRSQYATLIVSYFFGRFISVTICIVSSALQSCGISTCPASALWLGVKENVDRWEHGHIPFPKERPPETKWSHRMLWLTACKCNHQQDLPPKILLLHPALQERLCCAITKSSQRRTIKLYDRLPFRVGSSLSSMYVSLQTEAG